MSSYVSNVTHGQILVDSCLRSSLYTRKPPIIFSRFQIISLVYCTWFLKCKIWGQQLSYCKQLTHRLIIKHLYHRLIMELDLQSVFGLHVHSCTHWLRPNTPTPRIWAHTMALLVSQDRRHHNFDPLFVYYFKNRIVRARCSFNQR